jgi:hypothetical protein
MFCVCVCDYLHGGHCKFDRSASSFHTNRHTHWSTNHLVTAGIRMDRSGRTIPIPDDNSVSEAHVEHAAAAEHGQAADRRHHQQRSRTDQWGGGLWPADAPVAREWHWGSSPAARSLIPTSKQKHHQSLTLWPPHARKFYQSSKSTPH